MAASEANAAFARDGSTHAKQVGAHHVKMQRMARTSLLAACALVLSYLETMIPLPVALPGAKLGLANVAVVVALYALDVRCALSVALVKVAASGLLFGSPTMLAYSASGAVCAFLGMAALHRIPSVGCAPVSMVSAILHNAGQLGAAAVVLRTPGVFLNLPPLALCACVTGALTGAIAEAALASMSPCSRKPRHGAGRATGKAKGRKGRSIGRLAREGAPSKARRSPSSGGSSPYGAYRAGTSLAHNLDARAKIVFVTAFFVYAFTASGAASLCLLALVSAAAPACAGMGARQVAGLLKPFSWLMAFIFAFNALFTASGEVLFRLGGLAVTSGGVAFAAESIVRFACLLLGTGSLMRTTSPVELTDGAARLLSPLRRLNIDVDSAALATGMTLRFLPTLSSEMSRIRTAQLSRLAPLETGPAHVRLGALVSVISPLFASALRRADTLAFAVESRAFGAARRTRLHVRRMAGKDWLTVAFSCALAAVGVASAL